MTFDPKYFTGDIIASIYGKECTVEELIERFDNSTNGILYQIIVSKVDELVSKQLLHKKKMAYSNAHQRDVNTLLTEVIYHKTNQHHA